MNIDEQQNLIGFENLPEWEPDELECLLNELEIGVNENATHEPVFDSAQSMKFNFTSVCDVSGINILDDVTPVKVISQPISLQAAIELKQSSSKRKQNLNVTRDGIAEFIEVDDTNARRQLVFDSSNNFQQSISSEQTPEYAKENDPDKTLPSNGKASGMSKSDQTTVRSIKTRKKQSASKKKSSQSQSLDQNYHSTVVGTSTTEITYSRSTSKHGSDRFICICKRTFSSLKSYEEHRKTHWIQIFVVWNFNTIVNYLNSNHSLRLRQSHFLCIYLHLKFEFRFRILKNSISQEMKH